MRTGLRFVVAVLVSAGLCELWWLRTPRELSGSIDIVGYPTFHNYSFSQSFIAYRLLVYALPILVIATYAVLLRWGPLRRRSAGSGPTRGAHADVHIPTPAGVDASDPEAARAAWLGLVPPALLVAVAASCVSTDGSRAIGVGGLLAGLAYPATVALLTLVPIGSDRGARRAGWNGLLGASAAILGIWFVSDHTVVVVAGRPELVSHRGWLALPVALLGTVIVAGWALRLRGGRAPRQVERQLLSVVVGGAFVFLAASRLPGALGTFQGFDDAQGLVGADLISRGYFPWRDFYFIHGVYQDALQSSVGFGLFEHSRWGAAAGISVVLQPLSWVFLYWLVAWRTRANGWLLVAFATMVLPMTIPLDNRFVLAPISLLLLGQVLGTRRWVPAAGLSLLIFVQFVLVPESLFLILPTLVVIVGADLTGRVPGEHWAATWRRTWVVALGSLTLALLWASYLALNDALGDFIYYFRVVGPGHNASGALPSNNVSTTGYLRFGLGIALVLLTASMIGWRLVGRRGWTPNAWLLVAAGGFAALTGEKVLGRFDGGHAAEGFTAVLPLFLLWLVEAVDFADGRWSRVLRRPSIPAASALRRPTASALRRPAALLLVIVVAVYQQGWFSATQHLPARTVAVVAAQPTVARLGYADPGPLSPSQLNDVATLLDTYAGKNGPVFDFSNSLGYIYFLLHRRPASRFVHVSLAIPEFTQEQVVRDLKKSRPAVVVFQTSTIGLASWDGISNPVRHFIVSQYLLDGWVPFVRADGILLLLRRDLVATAAPLPHLESTLTTSGLYFTGSGPNACNWGDSANYLTSAPTGRTLVLPVRQSGPRRNVVATGWAVDPATEGPAAAVYLAVGSTLVPTSVSRLSRPDVIRRFGPGAAGSGFDARASPAPGSGPVSVVAVSSDGSAHVVGAEPGAPVLSGALRTPGGGTIFVGPAEPQAGRVDSFRSSISSSSIATIPAGVDLSDYQLATVRAGRPFGHVSISVSDFAGAAPTHLITAQTLPKTGAGLAIRVGSCLVWHGYTGRQLFLDQSGGPQITEVVLSGVK